MSSTHDDAIVEVILNIRVVKLMNKGLIDCEFIEIDFSKMYAHFFQLQNDGEIYALLCSLIQVAVPAFFLISVIVYFMILVESVKR